MPYGDGSTHTDHNGSVVRALTDTHRQTDGTDSITSIADAGGNNGTKTVGIQIPYFIHIGHDGGDLSYCYIVAAHQWGLSSFRDLAG